MARQVDDVDAVRARQRRHERREQPAVQRPPVQQHERRPAARALDVQRAGRRHGRRCVRHAHAASAASSASTSAWRALDDATRAAARVRRAPSALIGRHPEAAVGKARRERNRRRAVADDDRLDRRVRRQHAPRQRARRRGSARCWCRRSRRAALGAGRSPARRAARRRAAAALLSCRCTGAPSRTSVSITASARRRTRRTPRGLAERAHVHDAPGRKAGVREAAAAAQHAEAVRVVDDEPRVVPLGELEQARERRDVAVHAEHGVGGDDLARRAAGREARRERVGVGVRVADELRAREQRAVVQARVVEAVPEHRVAAAAERREDREVREVAGREGQRARAFARRDERGQLLLQRRVRRHVAADEVRRAGAHPPQQRGVTRGGDDRGIVGEAQVVVARERDERAAVDGDARTLRRGDRPSCAREALRAAPPERVGELGDPLRRTTLRPTFALRAPAHRAPRPSGRPAGLLE